jgi:uncharacterized membrane protein YphA (DoxX/SURF4 family)
MFSMTTFQESWNRFFYSKTDGSMLCLFRALLGFFLLLNGLSLIEDYEVWFGVGQNSLVPLKDSFEFYKGFRINLFKIMAPTDESAWAILYLYILSSLGLMLGFKTRLSAILCFVLLVSLQARNHAILNSGDTILRCMLFVLMFAPAHVKYSLDAWKMRLIKKNYSTQIPILSVRLLQLQFTVVYLATTLYKLKGYDWVDGTAVYYTSRLLNFQRFALPFVFDHLAFVKFFTWSALTIEFAMGTLVWIKEFRLGVLAAGILLHLGIEISMDIGLFEWIMISAYVLFLTPSDLRLFKRIVQKSPA